MSRIHRLQKIKSLRSTDFSDDQTVGTEPQGGDQQIADRKFPLPVLIRFAGFKIDTVFLLELKFAGILQNQNSILFRNQSA